MKSSANLRSVMVIAILLGAIVFALIAVGCFGGGDEGAASSPLTSVDAAAVTTAVDEGTTATTSMDPLSSFRSKDPFIPQAMVTTTTAPATTVPTVSTTLAVTTTAPHRLTVTAFPGGGFVAFTIDGDSFTSFEAGPALLAGAWGTIQILSVDDASAPFSATFRRNGTVDFTLELGASRTW